MLEIRIKVTGPAGSGKTRLVNDVLVPALVAAGKVPRVVMRHDYEVIIIQPDAK